MKFLGNSFKGVSKWLGLVGFKLCYQTLKSGQAFKVGRDASIRKKIKHFVKESNFGATLKQDFLREDLVDYAPGAPYIHRFSIFDISQYKFWRSVCLCPYHICHFLPEFQLFSESKIR